MKKKIAALLLVCCFVGAALSGCDVGRFLDGGLSDGDWVARYHDRIVAALQHKDAAEFKGLFSANAQRDAVDLDEGIAFIMERFSGEIQEKSKTGCGSGAQYNYGEMDKQIHGMTTIVTTEATYIFHFTVWYTNYNSSANGLHQVGFHINETNFESYYLRYGYAPGVLWQGGLTAADYAAGAICHSTRYNDGSLFELFSAKAKAENPLLQTQLDDGLTSMRGEFCSRDNWREDYTEFPEATTLSSENVDGKTVITALCMVPMQLEISSELNMPTVYEYYWYQTYFTFIQGEEDDPDVGFYNIVITETAGQAAPADLHEESTTAGYFYHKK